MKAKLNEYIIIYCSVIFLGMAIGAFGRIIYLEKGGDQFTGNVIFWGSILLCILSFAIITLFLHELIERIIRIFFRKKPNENQTEQIDHTQTKTENQQTTQNLKSENQKIVAKDANDKETTVTTTIESDEKKTIPQKEIEEIRTQQQILIDKNKQDKLEIALDYTRKKFALYTNDEDLSILCDAVKSYSDQKDISEDISITTTELSNLDLYHFGWNIWNYFKVTNQDAIAKFLKLVFVSLKDVEQGSIKSHLRDDEKKGIIKIEEIANPDD